MHPVAKRYSEALFKSAKELKEESVVYQQLIKLQNLFETNPNLNTLLYNPLYKKEEIAAALNALTKKIAFSALTMSFMQIIASQKRLSEFNNIVKYYEGLYEQAQGIMKVEITSARTLNAKQRHSLIQILEKKLNLKIVLQEKIDKDILGGHIIQVGPYLFNNSLSYKFNTMKQKLTKVI